MAKSPWEKLSRAMFIPARIICSNTGGELDAGPMVAAILVLCGGSVISQVVSFGGTALDEVTSAESLLNCTLVVCAGLDDVNSNPVCRHPPPPGSLFSRRAWIVGTTSNESRHGYLSRQNLLPAGALTMMYLVVPLSCTVSPMQARQSFWASSFWRAEEADVAKTNRSRGGGGFV